MIRAGDYIPTGHFFDGEREMWHDGSGLFFIDGLYYNRPDLLVGMPPPPPTAVERMKLETARLTTPWPSYKDAWRHAKAEKWPSRRYAIFGYPISFMGMAVSFSQIDQGSNYFLWFFIGCAFIVGYPLAWWRVYFRHLKSVDGHKAYAFVTASLGLASLALKAASARPVPAPIGVPNTLRPDLR